MSEVTTPVQESAVEQQASLSPSSLPPWLEQMWSDARVRYGAIAVAVVAVAIGAYAVWHSAQQDRENEASIVLSRVMPYLEAQQYDVALNGDPKKTVRGEPVQGLLAIADMYSGTSAGKTAALYAGQIFLERNKYDDAERYFEQAENSASLLVRVGAIAGLAACQENRKNFEEAARLYESILSDAESLGAKDKYTLFAAECYEKVGKTEQAIRLYKALLAEFELSEYAPDAKAGLVRLGTIVDY
ncbi:MAG: tetratricopeptide repeat protein [Chlorobi bacterium]|nr:tetratricopeptide repeat protein [Chlorobiota bacterium]